MEKQTDKIDVLHGQWLASQEQESCLVFKTILGDIGCARCRSRKFQLQTSGRRVPVDTIRFPSLPTRHATPTRKKVCHAQAGTNSSFALMWCVSDFLTRWPRVGTSVIKGEGWHAH